MKVPIKQQREDALVYMHKHKWVFRMVYEITRAGSPAAAKAEIHDIAQEQVDSPTTQEWNKARELALLYKIAENNGRPYDDMSGREVGALVVWKPTGYVNCTSGNYSVLWRCVCDCGNQKVVTAHNLNRSAYYCGMSNCKYKKMPMKERRPPPRLVARPKPPAPVPETPERSKEMAASILNSLTEHKLH